MSRIVDYINNHTIEEMVAAISSSNKDIQKAIADIAASRVEYQGKSQMLQWELEKMIKVNDEKLSEYKGF